MIAVIGDIHGCFYTLNNIVSHIRNTYGNLPIYAVGDLVDRGTGSAETVQYVIDNNINVTLGNHDYMFLVAYTNPDHFMSGVWYQNGNTPTIISYKKNWFLLDEHLKYFSSLPLFYNLEDCFISHAGISEKLKQFFVNDNVIFWENMDPFFRGNLLDNDGIMWTRSKLLNLGKLQVVGHSRKAEVEIDFNRNAAYIDTSAFSGNYLSAVMIENGEVFDIIMCQTLDEDLYLKNPYLF